MHRPFDGDPEHETDHRDETPEPEREVPVAERTGQRDRDGGGQSGATRDLEAGVAYNGTPARPMRESLKLQVLLGKLPEMYDAYKKSLKPPVTGKDS